MRPIYPKLGVYVSFYETYNLVIADFKQTS